MTNSVSFKEQFEALQTCVIIPTYNNASTLAKVIEDVSVYTDHIIIINDGSTDDTLAIIKAYPCAQQISYDKNVGKGWALRKAFAYAIEKGYRFAISIDSDGQHFAKDLPVFIERLKQVPDSLIIGARNMEQSSVPGKSSLGLKISNFWFWVETGLSCKDTQSGYRLYPLDPIKDMVLVTRKYELEIEVLVKAAWKGVKIEEVPVTVYYAPKETRISHFRPTIDFIRIGILNTILVCIAFLYIKPRDFLRTVFVREKFKQLLNDHIFNPHHSAALKSNSIAFGIFFGIIPIWGFQLVAAIFLSMLFKLNKPLVIIAAQISIPPMIPIIIYSSYKTGALWMGLGAHHLEFSNSISLNTIHENLQQYIYGSITLAFGAAAIFGISTFILLKFFTKKTAAAG